jgi:hypothetical protein
MEAWAITTERPDALASTRMSVLYLRGMQHICRNGKAHQSAIAPRRASKAYLPDGRQGCIEQGLEQLGVLRSCGEECLQLLQDVLQIGSVLLLHGCNVSGAELHSKCYSSPCVVPGQVAQRRSGRVGCEPETAAPG